MNLRSAQAFWQAALGVAALCPATPADEFDEIRSMADPAPASPEAFQAPAPFQPSADLDIVPLPIPHFTAGPPTREIDTVVIHFTSGRYVEPENPYDVFLNWKIFNFYRVSSHYMIGRDGTIYQLVRESDTAWHAGGSIMPEPDNRRGVNAFSIGIELIGMYDVPFEDAQYEALIALVRDIRSRHSVPIQNIVGHEHIAGQRAVELGLRRSAKDDPGPSFDWDRLRAGLDGPPLVPEPATPE